MISRLTASAAAFACIATTTIGWAASTSPAGIGAKPATGMAREAAPVVRLDTVFIVGRREAVTRR